MRVDFHTHAYTQSYLDALAKRTVYPYVSHVDDELVVERGREQLRLKRGIYDLQTRLKDMDRHGVDVAVVSPANPWTDIFGAKEAVAVSRRINDDVAGYVKMGGGRIVGFGALPLKDPSACIPELERIVFDLGLKGIIIAANVDGESLASPRFTPILKRAAELGIPVLVHPNNPAGMDRMARFRLVTALGYLFDTTLNITELIYDGFFEKVPDLKIILSHQGAALPYVIGRIDRNYYDEPVCREHISKPPSEYLKRMYIDTLSYDPRALRFALDFFGYDNVLYGTDYPFTLGGGSESPSIVAKTVEDLHLEGSFEERIFSGNASRLLKL